MSHGSLSDMATYAGEVWQMDSTPADVMTTEPDGKKRRCSVVAAIDIYSRRAVCVVAPTSKAAVVAAAMRKGILTWGVPSKVLMDNGKDYQSSHIKAVAFALNIDTPKLRLSSRKPRETLKGFSERWPPAWKKDCRPLPVTRSRSGRPSGSGSTGPGA